ncbi:MAG: DUF6491 family protein [bacterium]
MKSLLKLGIVSIFTILTACETTGVNAAANADTAKDEVDPRIGEKVDRICFARNIDGFSNNTKNSVVLSSGPNKDYYVETRSCFNMKKAMSINLDSRYGSCLGRGDYIIVRDSVFPRSSADKPFDSQRCVIKAIYKWDENAGNETDASDQKDTTASSE